MMRKIFSFLLFISLAVPVAQADTIHLKNGSVIKGKVTSFADDQFIVLLDAGSGRYLSRAMIYMGDVSRIEFDSAPAAGATDSAPTEQAASSAPPATASTTRTDTPVETQPIAREPQDTSTSREPEPARPEKTPTTSLPVTEISDAERTPRKLTGPVRTQSVDVAARRDWTSTGLILKRGDLVRITASGTVTLDQAGGRTSGPEGIDLPDPRKLMSDQPTGALIAVISADNDDFIFIGRSAEFTATRDGLLFLSVNEGVLSDNSGSYKAIVEVQSQPNRRQ
ncbi:MAG TPA: hypothetical protein VNO14_12200 [Blastocatellia bacterium]|nr:hypothetical protein [Blastocatellia bacterium]